MNPWCQLKGHSLSRPQYFGDKTLFIRHCKHCEYVFSGRVEISTDKKTIVVVKNAHPSYSPITNNEITENK